MSDKTPIFKWIWDACPAKNGDKLVLLCLACFADPEKDGECWAAPEMLEAKTGMTRRNIYRCMQRLVANGWLILGEERKVEHGRTLCRRYRIPYSLDNLSKVSSDNLSSSSDNLSVSLDNLSVSLDKLYTDNKDKEYKEEKEYAPATSSPSLPPSAEKAPKPKKASKPKFDATTLALPHGSGFAAAWAEFARHRQEIGHALTPTSAERTLKQLAAFNERDAVELMHRSVANGWRGVVFANDKKRGANVVELPPKPKGPSPLERSLAAMRAQYGQEDAA